MPDPLELAIAVFGSRAALAREMGVGNSAVSMWRKNGLPDAVKWRVLRAAKAKGIPLDPAQLERSVGVPMDDTCASTAGAEAA